MDGIIRVFPNQNSFTPDDDMAFTGGRGMKVPEYIKKEMHRVAHNAFLVNYHMRKIEDWLEKNGIDTFFDEGGLRDGSGCGLEDLEYGEDITEELCERIERMSRRAEE